MSFQAPRLYRSLGYERRLELGEFRDGISKDFMVPELPCSGATCPALAATGSPAKTTTLMYLDLHQGQTPTGHAQLVVNGKCEWHEFPDRAQAVVDHFGMTVS